MKIRILVLALSLLPGYALAVEADEPGAKNLITKQFSATEQAKEFKELGTCESSVSTYNEIEFDKETITNEVNRKPTIFYIVGSIDKGFTYYLSWYDENKKLAYDMQCAKMNMDADMKGKMVETALKMDV